VSTASDDRLTRGHDANRWQPDHRVMRELNRRFRRILMLNAHQRDLRLAASAIGRVPLLPAPQPGIPRAMSVAIDSMRHKLYVSDPACNRVLRYDISGPFDEPRTAEVSFGSTGRSSVRECWSLNQPHGLAVDVHGALWVADTGNHRIVRYEHAARRTSAIPDGIVGQPNIMTIVPGCSAGHLHAPRDVAIGSDGMVWVADSENHRVLGFGADVVQRGGMRADIVLGQASFTTRHTGHATTMLHTPTGVCLERDGTLWIVDAGNRRLVRHDDARRSTDRRADAVVGVARDAAGPVEPLGGSCTIDDSGRLWLIGSDGALRWWHHAALRTADAAADGRYVSPTPRGRLSGVAYGADALWLIDAAAGLVMRAALP